MQNIKILIIGMVIMLLGTLGAAGYFYVQYSNSQKELAILKASDLVKEIEILKLKLDTTERNLDSAKEGLATSEKAKYDLSLNLEQLRNGLTKIPNYLSAIDALVNIEGQGPSYENVAATDSKIKLLSDLMVLEKWQTAKAGIDIEKKSWMGGLIADTVKMITLTIGKLISK